MKRTFFIGLAMTVASGCERTERSRSQTAGMNSATRPAVDNRQVNERDRSPATLTAGDQSGSEADMTVTQRVRQGVVGHEGFSMAAANVKIITVDGVVTLRGPVNNEQEKLTIGTIAQRVDGVKRVDNQLEVTGR